MIMSTPIPNIEIAIVLSGIKFTYEGNLNQREARLIEEALNKANIFYRRTVLKKKLRFFAEDVAVIDENVLQLSTKNTLTIFEAVNEAITWAHTVGKTIQFTFNEVTMKVNGDSLTNLILRDYFRSKAGQLSSNEVGPYPKPKLTESEASNLHTYLMINR